MSLGCVSSGSTRLSRCWTSISRGNRDGPQATRWRNCAAKGQDDGSDKRRGFSRTRKFGTTGGDMPMGQAFVGLIVQLRLGPEFGPDEGIGDRDALIESLRGFLGEWPSTDSGSRSTNIKCWDIIPENWDKACQFAIH